MVTDEGDQFRDLELPRDGRPIEDIRCRCGGALRLGIGVGAGESEVLFTCEDCQVCYWITVRCD